MSLNVPKTVTPFEDKLLRITRSVLGAAPLEQALTHIGERLPRPAALSRAAVDLIHGSLANGCVLVLARSGGWRRERFLRDGKPRDGRLWERTAPADMPLHFSKHSLELLLWLTTSRPDDENGAFASADSNLTPADRLLVLLTYDALRDSEFGPALRSLPAFAGNGLARLAFADDWTSAVVDPSFATWCNGLGSMILEALTPWLAERCQTMEQRKSHIGDWKTLAAVGREQERMLIAFTDAAETASRLDLVRFLLNVAAALLPDDVAVEQWYGGLQGTGPVRLVERTEVLRRAVALPRHVLRLRELERRARTVGYLDDGYTAAQCWLRDWETLGGESLAERAQGLIDKVEPLKVGA